MTLEQVKKLCESIKMTCLGNESFELRVERDNEQPVDGRIFIQVRYNAPCAKAGSWQNWSGRKWYLSKHMTQDEIVKTAFAAFKTAVEHEVMEGFMVGGKILFNPHVDFTELLSISHREVKRTEQT